MKNKIYCKRCGSEMVYIENDGNQIKAINFDGEEVYFVIFYDSKNGKRLRILSCPKWAIVKEKGFFSSSRRQNYHDKYLEKDV